MDDEYLYQKIASAIRRDISIGVYQPGDDLPSIRKLKESWHCTIGTIQRALQKLEDEGLVSSHVGQKSKVVATINIHPADSLRRANLVHRAETFLLDMITSGYSPTETEDSFRLALERWRNVSQSQNVVNQEILRFAGSHDLAVAWMATHFDEISPGCRIHLNFSGSLSGLMSLAEGKADFAGSHLWDADTNTYNMPFIKKLFPGEGLALLTLASRRIGWFVKPGNPKGFTSINDLMRKDIRFVNRNSGSGIRVYLDSKLKSNGSKPNDIIGYANQKMTHTDIAIEIIDDRADVGLGMEAAAKANNLDFLFENLERYDLVMKEELLEDTSIKNLITWLRSKEFHQQLKRLGGYESKESGNILLT
jgi:molybdate-binding protein/DNA-binding transcriptional regulator YhcF (GntR family)